MALVHVSSNNNAAAATSVGVTFTPAGNNLLVVGCSSQIPGASVGTGPALQISDNNGNVWLAATPQMYGIPTSGWDRVIRIFYCISCNTGSTTITVSCANGSATMTAFVDEFSGASSSPFDQFAWIAGNSATANSGNVTTTTANQIVYGMLIGVVNTITKGATYTQNGTLAETCAEWKIVSSASTYSADGTLTSAHWLAGVATFSDQVITQPIRRINGMGTNVNTAGSTSLTLTYMPSGSGNVLAISGWNTVTTGTIAISDTNSNTITPVDGPVNQGAGAHMRTFYVQSCKAGATTFTITFDSSGIASLIIDEFSGVNTLDQHSLTQQTSGASGAYSTASYTTTQANEALWSFGMSQGSTTIVAPYTLGAQDSDGSASGFQIVNSIQTAQTAPFTDSAGTGQAEVAGFMSFFQTSTLAHLLSCCGAGS